MAGAGPDQSIAPGAPAPTKAAPGGAHRTLRSGPVVAILIVALIVVSVAVPLAVEKLSAKSTPWGPGNVPIRHIVILMMENHAFDNFFGSYCQTVGPYCPMTADGIPPGTCIPYNDTQPSLGCIRPYPYTVANLSTPDIPHVYNSTVEAIDGGKMDGFYTAENHGAEPFGYYNGTELPVAWDIAQEYALGDDFFSSALSYSLPNHWYLLAGQAPPITILNGLTTNSSRHTYLNEANKTETVQDLLNASPTVSWDYYDWALPSYQTAINTPSGGTSAYNFWNPLASRAESYTSWYVSHFEPRSDFFTAASNGTLPDVSWVIPANTFSDHPPDNLTLGESFIASVVDAVESSPDWSSTSLFICWDDYGGFYDHVPPPYVDPLGLSFRVPLLVVSPYTPSGLVVHSLGYFESLLHFVEWRFDLGCITARDCHAPLPFGYFHFNGTARSPVFFPSNATNAAYPMTAAELAAGTYGSATNFSATEWNTGPPNPNLTETDLD
jgi:phospholipase C